MGFAGAHPSCFRVSGILKESPVYCRTTLERRGSQFTSHACFWDCGRKSKHPARTHRHRENIQTPERHRLGDRHHNPTAVENTSRTANISCDKLQKQYILFPGYLSGLLHLYLYKFCLFLTFLTWFVLFPLKVGSLLQFTSGLWSIGPVWNGAPSNVEVAEPVDCTTLTNLGTVSLAKHKH